MQLNVIYFNDLKIINDLKIMLASAITCWIS